jgi:hypothetical protein
LPIKDSFGTAKPFPLLAGITDASANPLPDHLALELGAVHCHFSCAASDLISTLFRFLASLFFKGGWKHEINPISVDRSSGTTRRQSLRHTRWSHCEGAKQHE